MAKASDHIKEIKKNTCLTQADLAELLGASLVAIDRWERGDTHPSPHQAQKIADILAQSQEGLPISKIRRLCQKETFASRGFSRRSFRRGEPDLFSPSHQVNICEQPLAPILSRLKNGRFFGDGASILANLLLSHERPARTPDHPATGATSAGKNTYTYDAHTYHTKVPPQGIVEFLHHYLPEGGLVLDPFSGSGMTGVAVLVAGSDVILNE